MLIRKGTVGDIDEIAELYDCLNDYLESHTNYPGWRKGIYPAREDAVQGVEEERLFVAVEEGKIRRLYGLRKYKKQIKEDKEIAEELQNGNKPDTGTEVQN